MKEIASKLPSYADKIMGALDELEKRDFVFNDRKFNIKVVADEVNKDLCEIKICASEEHEARMYMIDGTGCMQIIIYDTENKRLSISRSTPDSDFYSAFCDAISMLIAIEELD